MPGYVGHAVLGGSRPQTGRETAVQINAFVPVGQVELQGEFVSATGIPTTYLSLPPLQANQVHQATAHILLCTTAENGTDRDPHFYIKIHDGGGELRARLEQLFIWEDVTYGPMKWRVFDLHIPFLVFGAGVYHFGVYAGADDGPDQALSSFLFPIDLDAPGALPFLGEYQPPAQ
jgi:hypothetical protein